MNFKSWSYSCITVVFITAWVRVDAKSCATVADRIDFSQVVRQAVSDGVIKFIVAINMFAFYNHIVASDVLRTFFNFFRVLEAFSHTRTVSTNASINFRARKISVYSVCFLTSCVISCFINGYVLTSFHDCTKASDNLFTFVSNVGQVLTSDTGNSCFHRVAVFVN